MITVRLAGGLGNQMFQYALGRHLSIINNTKLELDLGLLTARPKKTNYTIRNFDLGVYDIKVDSYLSKEPSFLSKHTKLKYLLDLANYRLRNYNITMEQEPYAFDEKILQSPRKTYLIGYWQSEKYFKNIEDIIRKDFSLLDEPDDNNKKYLQEIENSESVSVHIRRGDYISNAVTNRRHGVCVNSYYEQAINHMIAKINKPNFYIFSDDIEWTKENLKIIKYPVKYISHNGDKSYLDMMLMKSCKHHIIANSSFSWWGAWLSTYADKIIVAPKDWIASGLNNNQKESVYLKDWIVI